MNSPSAPPPGGPAAPGRRPTGRRRARLLPWLVAAPVPLALALLAGCAGGPADTAPELEPSTPRPGSVTTVPADPPQADAPDPAAPTRGSVTTVPPASQPSGTSDESRGAPSGAVLTLQSLPVAAAGSMSDYDREAQFGGWIDADGDCEDSRNEVLNRDLIDVTSSDGCTVATGTLIDPYTATTIDFVRGVATSGDVQADHVVSLGNAWITGAKRLSQADRVALANDPLNLLAVDGPTNGSKSDEDASGWLPPNRAFSCEMVAVQIAVKAKYGLWVTAPEKAAMAEVLSQCPGRELPRARPFGDIPGATASRPTTGATDGTAAVSYANCTAAREAGAAPLQRGEPGYSPSMDGDGDGVACE